VGAAQARFASEMIDLRDGAVETAQCDSQPLEKGSHNGRLYFRFDVRAQLVAGMRELAADAIESRLLLAAQRPIKVIERRLHRISCIDHRLQALLHSL
jgi:hypothetical protein